MGIYEQMLKKLEGEKIHMSLLDPASQSCEEAAKIAAECEAAGSDALMIGGSTGVTAENLDMTVKLIKESVSIPTILFPSGASALSPRLDAIYFMTVMNSTDPRFITGEQMLGAPYIKKMGLETIPMGYIIVEPGMTVGRVSKANPVKQDDYRTAIGYSLSAQMFGMKLVYLEAGSGAPHPVPPGMISAVKAELAIPLVVGGGIRTQDAARNAALAGGDIIVTGTIVEKTEDVCSVLGPIVRAIKS
ncbi:MAG: geranylgeranylglyceryl/heptaprenylglyceryl phosphate synthase [Candidatus Thermoplasmatota archaeon]|nr:geranylgeranylglyceryl/heptaprenylglyceryl phosphate synthase [Candidatus Thermoplasmatota archaeon]